MQGTSGLVDRWRSSDKYLLGLLVFTAVILFFRLSHADMMGDDAHYSVRAIGMVDFMFSTNQTTPLVWYGYFPWWGHLSFHDHPIILFLIQHFFLSINDSFFWARVPYVVMALGTIVFTYRWTKVYFNSIQIARIASVALVLNAHFIWFGRNAVMESGVLFFITAAWYYFTRFLKDEKYFWKYGFAMGVMLEVKFTTFFVVPAMFLYLITSRREQLWNKKFYYSLLTSVGLFLPIIIYNIMMYRRSGFFALQASRLLGQTSPWNLSGPTFAPLQAIETIGGSMMSLAQSISWPYFVIATLSLIYFVVSKKERWFLLSPIIFLLLEDATIGSKELYSIFLAPAIAVALHDGYRFLRDKLLARSVSIYATGTLVVYLMVFVLNSNWNPSTEGPIGWVRSERSFQSSGMWQLDQYLEEIIKIDTNITFTDIYLFDSVKTKRKGLEKYRLTLPEIQAKNSISEKSAIVFDSNVSWFARVWLVERRRFYENTGIIMSNDLSYPRRFPLSSVYFIKATQYASLDPKNILTDVPDQIEKSIIKDGITPKLIYRDDGKIAYKIYHVYGSNKSLALFN